MIALFDEMQRRPIAQAGDHLLQQLELRELVARPLQK